tara:strand:+ start:318 stop:1589 length:1272 start_codon:yes stop_codon:yes gene_type:complete
MKKILLIIIIGLSIYSCSKDPKSKLYSNTTIQQDTIGFNFKEQVLIKDFIVENHKIDENSMSYYDILLFQDSSNNYKEKINKITGKTRIGHLIIRGDTLYLNKTDMSPVTSYIYQEYTYSKYGGWTGHMGHCLNGKPEGVWLVGNTKKTYYNGKLHGTYFSYRSDRRVRLESKGNYKHGVKDGDFEFYFANGQLRHVINYKNGKLISEKYFDKNGKEVKYDNLKKYNYKEIYSLSPSKTEEIDNSNWMFPKTDIFLKSNSQIVSNGIVQKFGEDKDLIEKYISDNVTFKILMKERIKNSDTNYTITESMELISDYKWVQKEYYPNGTLEEYEEYIFYNGDFCKNGIERQYYNNGQLYSDCINYSPECGNPIIDSPESFNWNGKCKKYYRSGQIKEKFKYNTKDLSIIYKICYDEDGSEIDCEE